MKIAYANVRSLNTSFSLVEAACQKQNIQVLGLSEIWHPDNSIKESVRKSWNWIATERKGERGGGAALMISKNVKVLERKEFQKEKIEAVWCNVYSKESNFVLGSVYIPPNDVQSLKVLTKIIEKLQNESMPILIIGDLNAHHPYWFDSSANRLGNEMFDFLVDKELVVMNNAEPTRGDKIIDLTIASTVLSNKISNWKVQHEVYLNTDHNLITFHVGEEGSEEVTERLDFRKADWEKWKEVCSESVEEWIGNRSQVSDINEDYESFVEMLHKNMEECIPKKRVCSHSKGWWSPRLTELSKEYKKAKRLFSKRKDEANERKLVEILKSFKEEEAVAKERYLEEVVKLMDPRKPGEFWRIVNRVRKDNTKGVVQPIVRGDGTVAITDEEIFEEMKLRYGKETLDVKTYDEDWYSEVEEEVKARVKTEEDLIKGKDFSKDCGHENSDIRIEEVEAAVDQSSSNSAPSPEEQVFNLCLKKGGEAVIQGLHYLIQKSWSKGVLPEAFKLDPKIMLPKPGKSDYNSVRSYRPITLESVIGKTMERVICSRLVWKLEVEGGIADTQSAYRKQKSCIQTVLRICNSISEARNRKESSVLTVMDFESCYERIWREGLLKKASAKGIGGRLWLYIRNFLIERKYYIKVNEYTSQVYTSAVGIPQGSVISPILCNLYTSDAMEGIEGQHAEYADDNCLLENGESMTEVLAKMNLDLKIVLKWCRMWNMLIAPEKTEVMVFTPGNENVKDEEVKVEYDGKVLKRTKSKKILGIIVDDKLSFQEHVASKTKSAFSALKGVDRFVQGQKGCSQSVYMRLYRALVLPIMEYGSPVTVGAIEESCKEFERFKGQL